jgi:protein-tyrosine phosphatase
MAMKYVDIHSHILPGVDDGAQTTAQSLEMLRTAAEQGIGSIILTPHNKAHRHNVTVTELQEKLEHLQEETDRHGIPIKLYGGMEIFYRDGITELLEEGQLATLAGSRYVLVEFNPMEQFSYIRSAIYELTSCNFTPILAHVERYQCFLSKQENLRYIIERGGLIQVNASTFTGAMGLRGKQIVKKFLKERLIHFIGTDAHDNDRRAPLFSECGKLLEKRAGQLYMTQLMGENAEKVILNEHLS